MQVIDRLLDRITYRTHSDDNLLSVLSSVVVEQLVVGADLCIYLVHVLLNDSRHRIVVRVALLLLPGRRYPGSERNLSDTDGSDSGTDLSECLEWHPYQPFPSDLRNPMSRSSGSHGKYGNRRRS